jgi:hypothetical protein
MRCGFADSCFYEQEFASAASYWLHLLGFMVTKRMCGVGGGGKMVFIKLKSNGSSPGAPAGKTQSAMARVASWDPEDPFQVQTTIKQLLVLCPHETCVLLLSEACACPGKTF